MSLKWKIKNLYYDSCDWYRKRRFMKRIMKELIEGFIDKAEKEYDELHKNELEEE